MSLKLGQAFSLACLIRYGPLLPIESTGHLKEHMALFRSVAQRLGIVLVTMSWSKYCSIRKSLNIYIPW